MSSNFRHKIPFQTNRIAAIILAAGASTRLGRPKQLLTVDGKTLLARTAEQALFAKFSEVVVVLGAGANSIRQSIRYLPVQIVENPHWATGMGSSIACGVRFLEKNKRSPEGVVLMTCDQPFLTSEVLVTLVEKWRETRAGIVASQYEKGFGTPAFFYQNFFDSLKELTEKQGAKKIMTKHSKEMAFVPFPMGAFDIDTEKDFEQLKQWKEKQPR